MAIRLDGNEDFDGLKRSEPTLPAIWYYDASHHDRELREIWYRQWVYVCRSDALSDPMTFRTVEIGTQNILVLRDAGGTIRAFHNTCRHRGSRLCTQDAGRMKSSLIVCPYHQWSYASDGRLVRTTSIAEAPDFDRDDYALFDVHVLEWRGCVFVCLADEPPSIDESFSRRNEVFSRWPLETLSTGHSWRKTMACNWKTFWENFNECLHCPNVHPELCELVPIYGRRISKVRDAPDWQEHMATGDPGYVGGLREGAESWTSDGSPAGDTLAGLGAAEVAMGQTYFVSLPSAFIACHADYMRIVRILPLGAEATEVQAEWLFPPETLTRPDFDLAKVVDFGILVMEQDATASELNQQGLRSIRFEKGVLMPEEHHVFDFQNWVRGCLGGAGA